eukprot:7378016-Prymnesium_polylepis.2
MRTAEGAMIRSVCPGLTATTLGWRFWAMCGRFPDARVVRVCVRAYECVLCPLACVRVLCHVRCVSVVSVRCVRHSGPRPVRVFA